MLMSADDYDSWQETVYLLRSPENAADSERSRRQAASTHPRTSPSRSTNFRRWPAARSETHQLRPRCLGRLPVLVGLRPQDGSTDHETDRTDPARSVRRDRQAGTAQGRMSGYWSRRIDDEHRLVYRADKRSQDIEGSIPLLTSSKARGHNDRPSELKAAPKGLRPRRRAPRTPRPRSRGSSPPSCRRRTAEAASRSRRRSPPCGRSRRSC